MRNELELQATAKQLFIHMFEQRRPTILRDLKCIGAAGTLLREQNRLQTEQNALLEKLVASGRFSA